YLKVIATHAAVDYFRRNPSQRSDIPLDKVPEPKAEDIDADRKVQLQEVQACLLRVTKGPTGDRDRALFRLYYSHGLTAKAISQIASIGLSCEGVESVLGRLRLALRNCLLQQGHPKKGEAHERTTSP